MNHTFTIHTSKGERVVTVRELTATQATLYQFDLSRALATDDDRERALASVRLAIQLCAYVVTSVEGAEVPSGEAERIKWFDAQGHEFVFGVAAAYRRATAVPDALAGKSEGGPNAIG